MRSIIASTLCAVILLLFSTVNGSLAAPLFIPLIQANDGQEYTVQAGDTLSLIAGEELGDVNAWQQIIDATNVKALEDDRFETIEDATLIEVGQLLWIPIAEAETDAPAEPDPETDETTGDTPVAGDETESTDDTSATVTSTLPPITASATLTDTTQLLIPHSIDGRWYGYVDGSGEFQIEPIYLVARRFSEGLAVVSLDGLRFGYIDTAGTLVIPAEFSDAGPFSEGLAAVRSDDSIPTLLFYNYQLDEEIELLPSGYINQAGAFEIEPSYAYAEPFRGGLALVWDEFSSRSFLNRAGEIVEEMSEPIPTDAGVIYRTALGSVLDDAPARGGLCENGSAFGQDPNIWSCRVDEELFDPCFVQQSSELVFGCGLNDQGLITCGQRPAAPALVCGYPLNSFTVFNPDSASEPIASLTLPSDFRIERYQLRLDVADDSQDDIDCMLIAQETLAGAPPEIYVCSDGSFIIDDLWEVGHSGVWMARTVRLAGTAPDYEFVESAVAVVDEVWDFSAADDEAQPVTNILPPPPPGLYWQH